MAVLVNSGGGFVLKTTYEVATASYLTFVSGRTGDELDAALGKNNEDRVKGIGLALAMYAKFKDPTLDIATDFPALVQGGSLTDILLSEEARAELQSNENIMTLISKIPFAQALVDYLNGGIIEISASNSSYDFSAFAHYGNIDICVIGGGGAGGQGSTSYGGGGGGGSGFMENYTDVTPSSFMDIVIGAGGEAAGSNGGATSVTINGVVYTAEGGSCGTNGNGGNGGSGGGAGSSLEIQSTGGVGGSNGSDGFTSSVGSHTVGTGDGKSKYPFGDTTLGLYCGGGGGSGNYSGAGGEGGGGGGGVGTETGKGSDGTLYGAGGGGSHWNGPPNVGKGYQGAVFIRRHIA